MTAQAGQRHRQDRQFWPRMSKPGITRSDDERGPPTGIVSERVLRDACPLVKRSLFMTPIRCARRATEVSWVIRIKLTG
jgi:hypothetical protein